MTNESEQRAEPSGREPSIEQILERHMPGLRAFIRLRASREIRQRESCSDLLQSVCREVLEGADRIEYRGDAAFRSWLYTAALRKIVERDRYWASQKRDRGREVAADAGETQSPSALEGYASFVTPSRDAAVREQVQRLEEAFEKLTEEQREVLTLSRIVGLSHGEIAKQMGRTEESSRQLLRRTMVRLTEILEERGG